MKLLDLFCGAGGGAVGYHRAGFDDITGVDINPQPHYPFKFIQGDALTFPLEGYDLIHASPPCQGYSALRHLPWLKDKKYPLLIEPLKKRLILFGIPWVIENVERSPLVGIILCGQQFGLPIYRHRKFETNFFILQPCHERHRIVIGHGRRINDRRKGTLNAGSNHGSWGNQRIVTVAGGQCSKVDAGKALGIDWMKKDELCQAIPPAYTEWIGRQFLLGIKENSWQESICRRPIFSNNLQKKGKMMEGERYNCKQWLFGNSAEYPMLIMIPGRDCYLIRGTKIEISGIELCQLCQAKTGREFYNNLKSLLESKQIGLFKKIRTVYHFDLLEY